MNSVYVNAGPISGYFEQRSIDVKNNESTIWYTLFANPSVSVYSAWAEIDAEDGERLGIISDSGLIPSGRQALARTIRVKHDVYGECRLIFKAGYLQSSMQQNPTINRLTVNLDPIDTPSVATINSAGQSAATVNIGDSITIYTNRTKDYTHKIVAAFGTKTVTLTESCTDQFTWQGFTVAAFAGQIPNSTTGVLTFTITSYKGSEEIGSTTVSAEAILPSSVKPSLSVTLTNGKNAFGVYAQNLSTLKVKPTAAGIYSSTIKSIKISVTDLSTVSATSGKTYTLGPFSKTGNKTVSVVATDSRGRTNTYSSSITVVAYTLPTANVSASRGSGTSVDDFTPSDTGNKARIIATGSVCNINGNTITSLLQYCEKGTENWVTLSVSPSGLILNDSKLIDAADTKSYEIKLTITDKAGAKATSTLTLSNGFATMDFKAGGDGISFGKTADRSGFDCAMLMRILNGANLQDDSAGGYGTASWYYNDTGTQVQTGEIRAASDGLHLSALSGSGFLDGTWSGTLSDVRMKKDIEPIAKNIILAVGEVPFYQFRMAAPYYNHEVLYVGILAQDLKRVFDKYGVDMHLLMLDKIKLDPNSDMEYYCVEYTHFLVVRLLYDELRIQDMAEKYERIEKLMQKVINTRKEGE